MLASWMTLPSLTHTSIIFMGSPSSSAILFRNWRAAPVNELTDCRGVWLNIMLNKNQKLPDVAVLLALYFSKVTEYQKSSFLLSTIHFSATFRSVWGGNQGRKRSFTEALSLALLCLAQTKSSILEMNRNPLRYSPLKWVGPAFLQTKQSELPPHAIPFFWSEPQFWFYNHRLGEAKPGSAAQLSLWDHKLITGSISCLTDIIGVRS